MKNFLYSILLTTIMSANASAVVLNVKGNNMPQNAVNAAASSQVTDIKDWMKPQNGRVVAFDRALNIAIVNKKTYKLSTDMKVYDGNPVKGSRIRFNLNDKNMITDVWVVKK